jgi:hypothetical protein
VPLFERNNKDIQGYFLDDTRRKGYVAFDGERTFLFPGWRDPL